MKRFFSMAALLLLSFSLSAQYAPSTSWPYIYDNFTKGTLKMPVGHEKEGEFNVQLISGTLHYIDGNMIMEASPADVFSVRIGSDYYVNAGGRLMKVLAKNDNGFVAKSFEVDMAALNSTGGAYGSSSTTLGTMALSSLEGIGGGRTNMNHMELKANKENGKTLPVLEKMYLVAGGTVIFATRKDVAEYVGEDAMKAFLKASKVKWNNPQSLLPVLDLIANKQ